MNSVTPQNLVSQLAAVRTFEGAMTARPFDRMHAFSAWNGVRREVGLPPTLFGGFPEHPDGIPYFKERVVERARTIVNDEIERLAKIGIDHSHYDAMGVTPELMEEHAQKNEISLVAMHAFNRSAAEYLMRKLKDNFCTMGIVLESAMEYAHRCDERIINIGKSSVVLSGFLKIMGVPCDPLPGEREIARQRFGCGDGALEFLRPVIERALNRIAAYGPKGPVVTFKKQGLSEDLLIRSARAHVISHALQNDLSESYAKDEKSWSDHTFLVRLTGAGGLVFSISLGLRNYFIGASTISLMGFMLLGLISGVSILFPRMYGRS